MQLSYEDQRFLVKRIRLVQTWRYVGAILLAMLVGLGMWLFLSKPLLANPFVVVTRLKSDAIPEATMVLMAAMLPVVVLTCIALAVAVVLFAFAAFSNEKKYLQIIQCEDLETSFAQKDME
ncbi:MAG: hypothetical protein R6V76_03775 [Desulfobacterales bacterium]